MDVFGRVATRTPDNDLITFLLPLENGTRTDSELPANLSRNGDLSLRGDFGLRSRHGNILPQYLTAVMNSMPAWRSVAGGDEGESVNLAIPDEGDAERRHRAGRYAGFQPAHAPRESLPARCRRSGRLEGGAPRVAGCATSSRGVSRGPGLRGRGPTWRQRGRPPGPQPDSSLSAGRARPQ